MKTLTEKMKTMVGYCSSCGVEIIDLEAKKFLPNYANHIIELSNGTLMQVGVCVDCKLKLVSGNKVQKTADDILKNHKIYWKDSKDKPKDNETLTVVDPNSDSYKFHQKKILKEHEEHLKKLKT